jgi:hypothetical protein
MHLILLWLEFSAMNTGIRANKTITIQQQQQQHKIKIRNGL